MSDVFTADVAGKIAINFLNLEGERGSSLIIPS